MNRSFEMTAKRGIVAGLGLFGLLALLVPYADVRDVGTGSAWLVLVLHVAGPLLAVVFLSRWSRWPRVKPEVRVGLLIVTAWIIPVVALGLVGVQNLAGSALVALLLALSATALWWVGRGQRLDAAAAATQRGQDERDGGAET